MNSKTLQPTFSCFDDAIEFMDYCTCKHKITEGFWLVHGICERDGNQFAHAWVEDQDFAIFSGILNGQKEYVGTMKEDYYKSFGVKETTKYGTMEMLKMNMESGHFGPWEKKYQDLCGKGRTILGEVEDLQCFRMGPLLWDKEYVKNNKNDTASN